MSMPFDDSPALTLAFGLTFDDLYSGQGAARLDALFLDHLREAEPALAERLRIARVDAAALSLKAESELLIALGPHLEDFVAHLFGIEPQVRALEAAHHTLAPLYSVKRLFVQRKAMNAYKADVAASFDGDALRAELDRRLGHGWTELQFANAVTRWQQDDAAHGRESNHPRGGETGGTRTRRPGRRHLRVCR